jgi:hypothetical protein
MSSDRPWSGIPQVLQTTKGGGQGRMTRQMSAARVVSATAGATPPGPVWTVYMAASQHDQVWPLRMPRIVVELTNFNSNQS